GGLPASGFGPTGGGAAKAQPAPEAAAARARGLRNGRRKGSRGLGQPGGQPVDVAGDAGTRCALGQKGAQIERAADHREVVGHGRVHGQPELARDHSRLHGGLPALPVDHHEELVVGIAELAEHIDAARSRTHRRHVSAQHHHDASGHIERWQHQIRKIAHPVDQHRVEVPRQHHQQLGHRFRPQRFELAQAAHLRERVQPARVRGQSAPQRGRLQPVNVFDQVDQRVARLQVERAQNVAQLDVEIDEDRPPRARLRQPDRTVDRQRGCARAAPAAEKGIDAACLAGRLRPLTQELRGGLPEFVEARLAHRMNPTLPVRAGASEPPRPNRNSSTSPGSEISSSPGSTIRSPLATGATRCGVTTTRSSDSSRWKLDDRNRAPRMGRSPRSGTLSMVERILSDKRPAIAKLCPSRRRTVVPLSRWTRPGTVALARRSPIEKSMSETAVCSLSWMVSSASTNGVKRSWTPNFLNSTEMTPNACGIGIGNSPPARKVASWPDSATSVGSASVLANPREASRETAPESGTSLLAADAKMSENAPEIGLVMTGSPFGSWSWPLASGLPRSGARALLRP